MPIMLFIYIYFKRNILFGAWASVIIEMRIEIYHQTILSVDLFLIEALCYWRRSKNI